MFTGIVQCLGRLASAHRSADRLTLRVDAGAVAGETRVGDSICVSGVCLTVTETSGRTLGFDVIGETLSLTTLGTLKEGDAVNLEPSLRPSDRLGGHFVTGHVDGTGTLSERVQAPGEVRMTFLADPRLTRMMVPKGSIAVDGVSLTLTGVSEGRFSVALIPHTLAVTTLGTLRPGGRVNIETDLIGKWVFKALGNGVRPPSGATGSDPISEDFLREHGFV
jgi:riboflavin synthase